MNEQQHKMILGKTHQSGAEEWHCPNCGRFLLVNWEPRFMKTVIEAGDEFAVHSGEKGGLRMGSVQVATADEASVQEDSQIHVDDAWLAPWVRWLDEVDFENLWND